MNAPCKILAKALCAVILLHAYANPMEAKDDFVESGKIKYKAGEYQKAIKDFNACLHSHSADQEIIRLRGRAYLAEGSFDAAVSDFDAAGKKSGPLEIAMENQASLPLHDISDVSYPNWLKALVLLYVARINAEQGQLDRALKICDIALSKVEVFPEALALRGTILTRQNRLYESEEMYRQALSYRPRDWHIWLGYSTVLERQYKLAQSLDAISRAVELIKTPPYLESDLGKKAEYLIDKRDKLSSRVNKR